MILIFAILLDPFVSVSLSITAVTIMAMEIPTKKSLGWAVFLGWWGSVVAVERWGGRSLLLATLVLVIALVQELFEIRQVWVAIVISVIGEALWQVVFGAGFQLGGIIGQGLVCGLGLILIRAIQPRMGIYLKRS